MNTQDQSHKCGYSGCDHWVAFSDEPYCYTHSPDEWTPIVSSDGTEAYEPFNPFK